MRYYTVYTIRPWEGSGQRRALWRGDWLGRTFAKQALAGLTRGLADRTDSLIPAQLFVMLRKGLRNSSKIEFGDSFYAQYTDGES